MEVNDQKQRFIQEYVPGKQVTLAHLIANPNKDIYAKLGVSDEGGALGILTITPSEAAIIASDVATKSGDVKIAFLDRFSGSVVLTGDISSVESALRQAIHTLNTILSFSIPEITRS